VAAAHQGGRESVGCIILGRGEDDKKVHEWLANAAGVPGFIGFAVGRTDFWQPLVEWRANKITRGEAVAEVSRRYREFVSIFEQARLMREKGESKKAPRGEIGTTVLRLASLIPSVGKSQQR
jgi:5-dehydro-2-deoxygluconokinase